MELTIIILTILIMIILQVIFKVNAKNLKEIKKIGFDSKLNDITNKLPDNINICNEILERLDNNKVNVKQTESKDVSLYIAITNTIFIGDIKNTFTRVQTIAHECLHSIQDRKMLLFNFIFSNIYIIYYVIISILTLINKIENSIFYLTTLLIGGFVYYFIRSYLETDAMTKAEYLAKEYMESKNILTKEEQKEVIDNYKKLNKFGIPLVNFKLLLSVFSKVIIYAIISLV